MGGTSLSAPGRRSKCLVATGEIGERRNSVSGQIGRAGVPRNRVSSPGLVAVLCCSVGATWTVELHEFDPDMTLGPLVDWISTGVPTSQPEPDEASLRELLASRGLQLTPDSAAGPSTPSRRSIGYVRTGGGQAHWFTAR